MSDSARPRTTPKLEAFVKRAREAARIGLDSAIAERDAAAAELDLTREDISVEEVTES